jgi:hypothetical protein
MNECHIGEPMPCKGFFVLTNQVKIFYRSKMSERIEKREIQKNNTIKRNKRSKK